MAAAVVIFFIAAAVWLAVSRQPKTTTNTTIYTPPTPHCEPEDVQQCPDGTFVRRELPNCELTPCPKAATNTNR